MYDDTNVSGNSQADLPFNLAYAYTLVFFLNQKGDKDEAVKTLEALRAKNPQDSDAAMLLGVLMKTDKKPEFN